MTAPNMQKPLGVVTRCPCRFLIVGGGLAGLAIAIAVTQAGHEAIIFERMPVLREIGAGIQLPPNATTLFRQWSILQDIKACASQPNAAIIRSYPVGNIMSTQSFGSAIEKSYGAPYLLIHRAELHRILLSKAKSLGVTFKLGCNIDKPDLDLSNPSIRLSSGDVYEGDIILGADGERSLCREKLLGHEDPLRSSGDMIYRFTVKMEKLRLHANLLYLVDHPDINYWMGPDAHAVSYWIKSDSFLNVILTTPQDRGDDTQYGVQRAEIAEVQLKFKNWDPTLTELLGLAEECNKWSLLASAENKKWVHKDGKFMIVGDSAHAMLPYLAQGAAQAFEDAAALGTLFSHIETKDQIPAILEAFQELRQSRSMKVRQRSSGMRNVFAMPDGPAQQERDRQISRGSYEGSPIALADPVYQQWLWGHNASEQAETLWRTIEV